MFDSYNILPVMDMTRLNAAIICYNQPKATQRREIIIQFRVNIINSSATEYIRARVHATVCMPSFKPNHGLKLCFPL